jgi:hypothetical protein
MTEWRSIPSHPDFEASSDGDIRRVTPRRNGHRQDVLRGTVWDNGYRYVCIVKGVSGIGVHCLVCEAFHGPRPTPKHQAAHGDGDHLNNRPGNLRWATPKENDDDAWRLGRHLHGERSPSAKLTAAQVAEIRTAAGSSRALATQFKISQRQILRIKNGASWKRAA